MNVDLHIAFLMATLGTGGIGKMRIHLTRELVQRDIKVDLLLGKVEGPYLSAVDPKVRIINLKTNLSVSSLPRLILYLRRERPKVLITEKLRGNIAALRSRKLAHVHTCVITSVHWILSHKLENENLKPTKRRSKLASIGRYYPLNDGFIAVCTGIAQDLINVFKVPEHKIRVVYNPVVTPELLFDSKASVDHHWFDASGTPIILSAGRLEPQKDFPTLIRAFAIFLRQGNSRLVILGEGKERHNLQSLAVDLGIEKHVFLPGFVKNPYAFMARADLFVLSSAWEGFGNALVEALATGLPVVATDCPSGPREILQDGRYGPLVPVGDADALSLAMLQTLDHPLATDILQSAAKPYTAATCADGYLKALASMCK